MKPIPKREGLPSKPVPSRTPHHGSPCLPDLSQNPGSTSVPGRLSSTTSCHCYATTVTESRVSRKLHPRDTVRHGRSFVVGCMHLSLTLQDLPTQ